MEEIEKKLLAKNIISLRHIFDLKDHNYVRDAMEELESRDCPAITVNISSSGGDAELGLHTYDLLRMYKGPTTIRVIDVAHSTAAIILQAADQGQRLAAQHSEILIHTSAVEGIKRLTVEKIRDKEFIDKIIKRMELIDERALKIFCQRTGKDKKFILDLLKEDRGLTAKEAKKIGLIDEII